PVCGGPRRRPWAGLLVPRWGGGGALTWGGLLLPVWGAVLRLWLVFTTPIFAADLVPVDQLGLRVARGFRVTQYADADLANDIYAMTLDARGNVVVTGQGYIKTLFDLNGDGRADTATNFAETVTGGMGMCF